MSNDTSVAQEILGPLVRQHRTKLTYMIALFSLAGLLLAIGLIVAFAFGAVVFKEGSKEPISLWLALTLPFLLGGAAVLVWGLGKTRRVVALHQNGIYYKDGRGERAIAWHSIESVYQKLIRIGQPGMPASVQDTYTIVTMDGTRLVVDHRFDDIEVFGTDVCNAVTGLLFPRCREAFYAGRSLDFGAVTIDSNGVHHGGKVLGWNEVEGISQKQGLLVSHKAFLQIRRMGGLLAWAKVPVEDIKNYQVLMALVREMGKLE